MSILVERTHDMSINAISGNSGYWEELNGLSSTRNAQSSQRLAGQLLQELDIDQNDEVSLQESGLEQSLFSSLDHDGSGTVSMAELEAALENAAMFARMQAEGVGLPSQEGRQLSAQDLLAAVLNGGQAEEAAAAAGEEAAAGGGGGGGGSEEYDELDTNEDGVVSAEELRAAMMSGSSNRTGDIMSMLMGLFSALANDSYNSAADGADSGFSTTA
jgi:Ca2+-binding EF-hand superfamily protein